MDNFDWNRSKEDLLTETRYVLADVLEGTGYTIVRNTTQGEKMNNIYRIGSDKRVAFIVPIQTRNSFTFVFNIEYLPAVQASGAKIGKLEEIKKGRYPNWRQAKDLSYNDLRLALSSFVKHF